MYTNQLDLSQLETWERGGGFSQDPPLPVGSFSQHDLAPLMHYSQGDVSASQKVFYESLAGIYSQGGEPEVLVVGGSQGAMLRRAAQCCGLPHCWPVSPRPPGSTRLTPAQNACTH